jgi:argininosuccinate lyase
LSLLVNALDVRPDRLRAGFGPGVFATDRALELVAGGMPFRDAYQQVRANLGDLVGSDPDEALAAKSGDLGTADLDFELLRGRVASEWRAAQHRRRLSQRAFARLLGVAYPSLEG